MTINPNNLLKKISSPNSEVVISTLSNHIWVANELDTILTKHNNKDLFFVWWVTKDFVSKLKQKKGGRTSDGDITEKNYFFIDIDIRKSFYEKNKTVLSQEDLFKHIEEIRDILNADPLFSQRSFINCSGNGMHIFYIGKPYEFEEEQYKAWVKYIYDKFIKTFWDKIPFPIDTSCCNIWHLARLTGSINHKTDYHKDGISLMPCEILYEQDIESKLFNDLSIYAEVAESERPEKRMAQTIRACTSQLWQPKIIPGSLMDKINQKPLVDLVLEYTWWHLASDNRNFMWGKNDWYKWCFMHEVVPNVLVLEWTPHIPNSNNLLGHTTFTFIRDVLCNGDTANTFKKAKELYPDLKDIQEDDIDIWDPFEHFIPYGDLVKNAVAERRKLDIHKVCKFWIKILDDYLGGILPAELVVIWAETGIGKSELAYTIALENANKGKRVLLFGLEWDINEIAIRHIQKLINETSTPIKTVPYRFNLDKSIYKVEDEVVSKISESTKNNLFIFNKLALPSIWFIKELVEKVKDSVDLIIIDHLHYIYLDREDELRQIGDIMRTLKTITDIVKRPIVLVSHLRKKDNKVKERDPEISDLYWSSNIWKEATTILLISKMRAADTWTPWIELPAEELDKRYLGTKIIIAKSRVWVPKSAFWLIYDLDQKKYPDKFQAILQDESWAKEEDKIAAFEAMEI